MRKVAFQGELGAYSHMACTRVFPEHEALPCRSFREALRAVSSQQADVCLVPTENSVAGRVAELHRLLPEMTLHMVAEHFQPIRHTLMTRPGVSVKTVKEAWSHPQALAQCRKTLETMGITPITHPDTAGSARLLRDSTETTVGVIASEHAADIYGLQVVADNLQDQDHNMTRFIALRNSPLAVETTRNIPSVTSLIFRLRSVPAALYKALGGFATNGINLTRIESYLERGSFEAACFFVDAEGHWEDASMQQAMDELRFYCEDDGIQWLGTYPAHPLRKSRMIPREGT